MLRGIYSNSFWSVLTNISHWSHNKVDSVTNTDKPDSVWVPLQSLTHPIDSPRGRFGQLLWPQHNQSDGASEPCLPSDFPQTSPLGYPSGTTFHIQLPPALARNWSCQCCRGLDLCEEWCPLIQALFPAESTHMKYLVLLLIQEQIIEWRVQLWSSPVHWQLAPASCQLGLVLWVWNTVSCDGWGLPFCATM